MSSINICVLGGGWSNERAISLKSSKSVYECLKKHNHSVFYYDMDSDSPDLLSRYLADNNITYVFNLIHGKGGEDGTVQKYLEEFNVNFCGSDSKSSSISFDKYKTKEIWISNELNTPNYEKFNDQSYAYCKDTYGKVFFIKDVCSGSSNNIFLIKNENDFINFTNNQSSNLNYIIEEKISANEYTAAIIHGDVLPLIQIVPTNEFYDFDAKYNSEETKFLFPDIGSTKKSEIDNILLKAFDCLGCQTWGRIDFFIENDKVVLLEINTIPGMTDHSLVPKAANKIGIGYYELILKILNL